MRTYYLICSTIIFCLCSYNNLFVYMYHGDVAPFLVSVFALAFTLVLLVFLDDATEE